MKVAILGCFEPFHVGSHLREAAIGLGIEVVPIDFTSAYQASWLRRKISWWIADRRPASMEAFCRKLNQICMEARPEVILATGIAPIDSESLRRIQRHGIYLINFLTDDPWNPAHRSDWFFESLRVFDEIHSPRRTNLADLREHGCRSVQYTPFAYAPSVHFPESQATPEERSRLECEVGLIGGADADRVPLVRFLIRNGIHVKIFGSSWNRYLDLKKFYGGHLGIEEVRKAVRCSKLQLCIVRRANRDGHAMRSFELPAMRSTMLVESTDEHREIFGSEGDAVVYFQSNSELVSKARWLLDHPSQCEELAERALHRIRCPQNTYAARLQRMLEGVQKKGNVSAAS